MAPPSRALLRDTPAPETQHLAFAVAACAKTAACVAADEHGERKSPTDDVAARDDAAYGDLPLMLVKEAFRVDE